ncbi:hypothetical protein ID0382_13510 [Helicobacter pylori]
MVQIHSPQPISFKKIPPIFLNYPFKKTIFNKIPTPNEQHQTKQNALKSKKNKKIKKTTKKKKTKNEKHQKKQNALKSKNDKSFKKMTKKKKRFYAIMLQIHSKCPMNV